MGMLMLGRRVGEWIEITHRSGDVLLLKVHEVAIPPASDRPPQVNLGFRDDPRNFEIRRPDR